MVGQWAQTKAVYHALIQDKELPPASKAESEKKTNWAKVAEYRRWREEHDREFRQALASPKHFGVFLGMPSVLGEPPQEETRSAEQTKEEEAERARQLAEDSKVYFLNDSIFARAAREGKEFSPADSPPK